VNTQREKIMIEWIEAFNNAANDKSEEAMRRLDIAEMRMEEECKYNARENIDADNKKLL
jgi:hypothetical protein